MSPDPALCFLEAMRKIRNDRRLQRGLLAVQKLHVSAQSSTTQDNLQIDGGGYRSYSDCSQLASSAVVSNVNGYGHRGASPVGRYKVDSVGSCVKIDSGSQIEPIGGIQSERSLQSEGFSKDAVDLIQFSISNSTTNQYSYKWNIFQDYCKEISVDPFKASEVTVTNFLAFIKKKRNLGYSAVCGYRSAISRYHAGILGIQIGNIPRIKRAVKGVWRQTPLCLNIPRLGMYKKCCCFCQTNTPPLA